MNDQDELAFRQMSHQEKKALIRARLDAARPVRKERPPRDPLVRRKYATRTAEEKFWRRVRIEGECWLWQRGPFLSVEKGRAVSARVWAIEHFTGAKPTGKVFSTCGRGNCVLPAHQEEVPAGSECVPAAVVKAITRDARSDFEIAQEYHMPAATVARIRQSARLDQIVAEGERALR